ncbi:MAG: TIGR03943 family putative permease subunit [Sarcina sp.]
MKRFNLDQFIWFCILAILSVVLTTMLFTGKIFMLIDGERVFSTVVMLVILYLLTLVQATRIFTVPSRGGVKKGYFQYVILICILILVSVIDIPKTSLLMKGVKLYHSEHNHGEKHNHTHTDIESDGKVIINEANFHDGIEEIIGHKDKYIGKEIEIEGTYFKDKKYPSSFIITQLNMNCCIADSEYLGILCEKNNLEGINLGIGDKIKVVGKISSFQDKEKQLVKIDVLEIIENK